MIALYDDPAQMEPLFIDSSRPAYGALIGRAHELSEASACFESTLPLLTAQSLSQLVAGMNCYYSNLIEGHYTLPFEIEQALHDLKKNDIKTLASAHIEADQWAQTQTINQRTFRSFVLETHQRFCEKLPPELLRLKDGSSMAPGQFRSQEVHVGRHVAPGAAQLDRFLERFAKTYGNYLEKATSGGINKLEAILATFIAHHRFVWIHPFPDGNGRVSRILMDAMLRECGVNQHCLWSMSRGFAKSAEAYKSTLAEADQPRMGDLDGRGNLSERTLIAFCEYAMNTAIDQAKFMAQMFALDKFKSRAEHFFRNVRFDLKPESVHLYLQAFTHGEFERMEAGRITGLAERTARNVLNQLIKEGFLVSETPKGKVRVGFPVHALGSLLPNLYPAGDVDLIR
ncbi:MAG: Fic family protein [Fluviibacter sp.]